MHRAPLDWDDLRYFLAVARSKRLARAGKVLGVRHTTVARRIGALEESLAVRLFRRTALGWELTRAGERVLSRAAHMEEGVLGLLGDVHERSGVARGRVRIALVDTWAAHWLAPRLPLLRERHPDLEVELLTSTSQHNLTRGEADIAVRMPRPVQRDLLAIPLVEASFGLYARPDLARRWRTALDRDPPDPQGVPLGVYTREFALLQKAAWFRPVIDGAQVRLRSSNTEALLAACRAGVAICVLPHFVGARQKGIVSASSRDVSTHRSWLAVHRELRHEPSVDAVLRFLREIAEDVAACERRDDRRSSRA